MRKALNGLMSIGMFVILLAAMAFSLLRPKTDNLYENRPAVQLPAFTLPSALSGEYQDALESALHDQLPKAQRAEGMYQDSCNALVLHALSAQIQARPNAYYQFNGMLLFQDNIVYSPLYADLLQDDLGARIDNLNHVISAHPELSFYVYYIEKDTDLNLTTGEKTGFAEALRSRIQLPESHMGTYTVDSFEQFHENFYRTDHHWNRFGSYTGYQQVLELLGKTDPLQPTGTVHLSDSFCGSKAVMSGASTYFSEPFDAFTFDFPVMTVYVSGNGPADYGRQGLKWDERKFGPASYGSFYGFDDGEVAFHTGQAGAGNILVIGESFDNAILKLLAGHFENLYAVDLRAYEEDMGEPFRFSDYLREHEIDTVLFIGNVDFFLSPVFDVEG